MESHHYVLSMSPQRHGHQLCTHVHHDSRKQLPNSGLSLKMNLFEFKDESSLACDDQTYMF